MLMYLVKLMYFRSVIHLEGLSDILFNVDKK